MSESKNEKKVGAMLSVSEARKAFADVVIDASVRKHRVVVTRNGRPACVVVPIEDLEALEALEDRADEDAARRAYTEWKAEGSPTVSLDEIKMEFGLKKRSRANANVSR